MENNEKEMERRRKRKYCYWRSVIPRLGVLED